MRHTMLGQLVGAMWLMACAAPGAEAPVDPGDDAGCGAACFDSDAALPDRDAWVGVDAAIDRDATDPLPDATVAVDAAADAAIDANTDPTTCVAAYATGPSRCAITDTTARCDHIETTIGGRMVYSQVPIGDPPADGWPAVVVYQGSGFGPTATWTGDASMPFGGFNQVKLQAMLLDNGFAVIAPSADGAAWNTNFPGYDLSSDSRFIPTMIDAIDNGTFGEIDPARLYATGISSGGYMTSRMAVSYAGTFRALAIQSGSYATCSNLACAIPNPLPTDHPPTLFLHGANDIAVPMSTAQAYDAQLKRQGIETAFVTDPTVGHQWLKVAPETITCWFKTH